LRAYAHIIFTIKYYYYFGHMSIIIYPRLLHAKYPYPVKYKKGSG